MKKIIHVDMDAFYAAVEQRNNPSLKGKPVVVGGAPHSRGVVSTCSYEARKYGIHSAMPSAEAFRRCPHAVFITKADFGEYRKISHQIQKIFREVTDAVEPLSLDEAYLDVTDNTLNQPSATRVAQWIRKRIIDDTGLTASAGVSFNKSLAKIASDLDKPDGLTVITPERAEEFIRGLPVRHFFGVGPVTAKRMERLGIRTGGDLRRWPLWKLIEEFGKAGPWYYELCRGIDHREVVTHRTRKSLGRERTFGQDMHEINTMIEFIHSVVETVWKDLDTGKLAAKTVTVKVKYADFRQVTRSRTLNRPLSSLDEFRRIAVDLLRETEAKTRPVRLLGVSTSSFFGAVDDAVGFGQLDLGLEQ